MVDTDIGPDCDDVGALCILHELRRQGAAEILAITCCASHYWGPCCVSAINRYYGDSAIPIGQCPRKYFLSGKQFQKYNRPMTTRFPLKEPQKFLPALQVLRQSLAAAMYGSVVLVTIGPLNNIADLLRSGPDDCSPLSGIELAAAKIRKIVLMAGCFEPSKQAANFAEWKIGRAHV